MCQRSSQQSCVYLNLELSTWGGKQKEIVALQAVCQAREHKGAKKQANVLAAAWHLAAPALKMKCVCKQSSPVTRGSRASSVPCAEQKKTSERKLQGRHESHRQNDFNFGYHFDIELKFNCYFPTKGGIKSNRLPYLLVEVYFLREQVDRTDQDKKLL